jgi:hypothetical protein
VPQKKQQQANRRNDDAPLPGRDDNELQPVRDNNELQPVRDNNTPPPGRDHNTQLQGRAGNMQPVASTSGASGYSIAKVNYCCYIFNNLLN